MLTAAKIFQSGMVLQRDKPLIIWGTAEPGAVVSVSLQGISTSAAADRDGAWRATLPAMPATEDVKLVIAADSERIELSNIAIGEVWIAGGQSNMGFWMRYEKHCREEKQTTHNSRIRFYAVARIAYDGQERDFDYSRMERWRTAATPEDIDYFSAAGYYFAKELERELDVPVGIIGCNWGGTSAIAWMSTGSARQVSEEWAEKWLAPFAGLDMDEYREKSGRNPANDTGNPFANAFNEFMTPRTPSREEIDAFFAGEAPPPEEFAGLPQPQDRPGTLYEHMVRTIAPYALRGVLWYQGETDDQPGYQQLYGKILAALTDDWRGLWADDTLPFLVVQLPGWESWLDLSNFDYTTVRQCQQEAADRDENIYLCSISDAGERLDIHPKDKKVVGQRLSLLALGHIYGRSILCDAPRVSEARRDGNTVILRFANAEGGLSVKGNAIEALAVFNEYGAVDFHASAENESVVITLPEGTGPVRVDFARTAWYRVNLYNRSGIPAIPFSLRC